MFALNAANRRLSSIVGKRFRSSTPSPLGFIGKKHLQRAIDTVLANPLPHAPRPIAFSVLRVPFFLEPNYDESLPYVESNRERLIQKWGGPQGWERQKKHHNLKGRGLKAGIPHFNLDRKASNTMASHRLIQWVGKTYGLDSSERIYDKLNTYYFVDGHALNDRPRLAQVVAEALQQIVPPSASPPPPTEATLLEFLQGDQGRKEVENTLKALKQMGVNGIPVFLVEGSISVDGAAESNVFIEVFREIEGRGSLRGKPLFADLLGVSPEILQRGSHHAPESISA